MDLAGPPLSLRDEYAGLGAAPTALCLERLLNRLDLPALEQGPHRNLANPFARKPVTESLRSFTAWPCARRDVSGRKPFVISFAHCLWLVARPALDWIAQAPDDDASCHWTPRLNQCVALLHLPFVGVDDDGQAQQVQHMTELAVILLKKHLDVDVDQQSLHATMMPLLDRGLPATGMAVYVVLLSFSTMESIIGRSLHDQLIRCLLAEAANLPLPKSLATLETGLKRELVQQLALQTRNLKRDIVQRQTTPTKLSRTHTSRDTALSDKMAIVRTILVKKIALQHMVTCFLDADRLRHQLLRQPPDQADPLTADHLYSRQSITKHMLLLDSALDSVPAEQKERGAIRTLTPSELHWRPTKARPARIASEAIVSRSPWSTSSDGVRWRHGTPLRHRPWTWSLGSWTSATVQGKMALASCELLTSNSRALA